MRGLCVGLAVAAAATGIAVAPAALSAESTVNSPVTFTDPAGDSGTAADITSVATSNDTTGTYTWDVTLAAPLSASQGLVLVLDSDNDRSTGVAPLGADYEIGYYHGIPILLKSSDASYSMVPAPTLSITSSATHVIVKIRRTDIGGSTQFNFWVATVTDNGSADEGDQAPDSLVGWNYKEQFELLLQTTRPGVAVANKTWTYGIEVERTDTNQAVGSEGTIHCAATGRGVAIPVISHAFVSTGGGASSFAVCNVHVPARLKNKVVHGTISVAYGGKSISHSFVVHTH